MDRDLEPRIRERAYELWEAEGQPHGRDRAHWDQARAELGDGASAKSTKAPRKTAAKPKAGDAKPKATDTKAVAKPVATRAPKKAK